MSLFIPHAKFAKLAHFRSVNQQSAAAFFLFWGIVALRLLAVLRQRSWHNRQQLGDFLRVAGGGGSDATAKAVGGLIVLTQKLSNRPHFPQRHQNSTRKERVAYSISRFVRLDDSRDNKTQKRCVHRRRDAKRVTLSIFSWKLTHGFRGQRPRQNPLRRMDRGREMAKRQPWGETALAWMNAVVIDEYVLHRTMR